MLRSVGLCVLAAVSSSCESDLVGPSETLAHSVATHACAPEDGPAVAIYFAPAPVTSVEPPAPFVRVAIWQTVESLSGASYRLTGETLEGGAWYHSAVGHVEMATSGVVRINNMAPDTTIEGSVDLAFPSTGLIQAAFQAEWIAGPVLCG